MTISTYTELKAAVESWLHRSNLTANVPDFIRLAESRLNRKLRLRAMVSMESLASVIGSRNVTIPAGFLEPLGLWITHETRQEPLRFVASESLPYEIGNGEPKYWTIQGLNLAFERPADQVYTLTLRMYKSFNLSDASPTNWLLTNYPDIYLYGTLLEAAPFMRDKENIGMWKELLAAGLDELIVADGRHKSLSTLSVEPMLAAMGSSILDG